MNYFKGCIAISSISVFIYQYTAGFQKFCGYIRKIAFLAILILFGHTAGYSQDIVSNTNKDLNNNNIYPFGSQNVPEIQIYYGPNDFNTIPNSGYITKIYFRFVSVSKTKYTGLTFSMTQVPASGISKSLSFITPLKTVFGPDTFTMSPPLKAWYGIPLTTPFYYDSTKALVVDIKMTGFTSGIGELVNYIIGTKLKKYRIYYETGAPVPYAGDTNEYDFGFDINPGKMSGIQVSDPERYVSVYPNPGNGIFTVEADLPASGITKINVYNELGKDIYTVQNSTDQNMFNVDLGSQPNGIYFMNIVSGKEILTRKIIIAR